jgi:hypothetical protein
VYPLAKAATGGSIFMSELDVAKENIAYLKVWLGILVVADISTFGWLISNVDGAIALLLWGPLSLWQH